MLSHVVLVLSVVLAIAVTAGESVAATDSWVKINGVTHKLPYSYAVPSPNALDSEKANGTFDTYLILVDAAIPNRSFADVFWYKHLLEDAKIHGLVFIVDAEKQPRGGGVLLNGPATTQANWAPAEFAITASDAQRLRGAGKIAERVLPGGPKVAFDVTFDAAPWKLEPVKPPTSADAKRAAASPQAKVYSAYLAALKSGNSNALLENFSADAKKQMPESAEALATMMKVIREMAPKYPRAVRLTVDGNSAELEVADGQASGETVQFVLEDGKWKIERVGSN
ncbi:MAG: hypothetical protein ACLQKA_07320 [Bryobacteraceae bacterium]